MGIRNTEKRKLITDPKLKHLEYSGIVGWNALSSNHRHDVINKIIDYLKDK